MSTPAQPRAKGKGGTPSVLPAAEREQLCQWIAAGYSNREIIEMQKAKKVRQVSIRTLVTYRSSPRVKELRRELTATPEAAQVLVPALTDTVVRTSELARKAYAYLIDGETFHVGGKDIGARNAITILNDARRFFFTEMGGGEIASDLKSFGKEVEQAAAGMSDADRKELLANVKESQVAVLRKIAEEARRKQQEAEAEAKSSEASDGGGG